MPHQYLIHLFRFIHCCKSRYFEDIVKVWIFRLRTIYNFFQVWADFYWFENPWSPTHSWQPLFPPRHLSSGQPLRCIVFQWHKLCKFPVFTSKIALIGRSGVGNEPVAPITTWTLSITHRPHWDVENEGFVTKTVNWPWTGVLPEKTEIYEVN